MKSLTLRLLAVSLLPMLGVGPFAAEVDGQVALTITNNAAIEDGPNTGANDAVSRNPAPEYRASGSRAGDKEAATLHLSGGDYLAGELCACGKAGTLRWQSPAFAAPLEFPVSAVGAVFFPASASRPRPDGGYCLELAGGDVLFGSLTGLSKDDCRFDAAGLGPLNIQRLGSPSHFAQSRRGRPGLFGTQRPAGMEAVSRRRVEAGRRPDLYRTRRGVARWRSWPSQASVHRFRVVLELRSRFHAGPRRSRSAGGGSPGWRQGRCKADRAAPAAEPRRSMGRSAWKSSRLIWCWSVKEGKRRTLLRCKRSLPALAAATSGFTSINSANKLLPSRPTASRWPTCRLPTPLGLRKAPRRPSRRSWPLPKRWTPKRRARQTSRPPRSPRRGRACGL